MKAVLVIVAAAFYLLGSASVHCKIVPFNKRPRQYTTRIINGEPARADQFPWYVLVKPTVQGSDTYCGGSIISNKWVLTAGHCVHGFDFIEMHFGSIDVQNMPLSMNSRSWVLHPEYNPDSLQNDIAVVSLPVPLSFTNSIRPLQLLSLTQAKNNFSQQVGQVAGFGYTSDEELENPRFLMFTNVRVISNVECKNYYGEVVYDSTLCAQGTPQIYQSTCHGDSGGPLVIEDGEWFTQIGVISFVSDDGCGTGSPSGYARLGSFLQWVSNNTGITLRP